MRRPLLVVATLVLLSASGYSALGQAGSEVHAQTATTPSKATVNPDNFVGAETCAACHEDVAKKFSSNPHWKLALTHGETE